MNTRTIQPGERGLDFSYVKPPPQRVVDLGYTFVVGYVSPNPDKNLLNPQAYLDVGLAVLFVWEVNKDTPAQGAARGLVDGKEADKQVDRLQYPDSLPIIAAVDTNTTPALFPAHDAYLDGFQLGAQRLNTAAYCNLRLFRARPELDIGWIPNAWAWSSTSRTQLRIDSLKAGAHVLQGTGFYIDNKYPVDPNEVLRPIQAWSYIPDKPTPIEVKEQTMYISNSQTRTINGQPFDPGHAWYEQLPGGHGRAVSDINDVLCALGGTEQEAVNNVSVRRSNTVLDALMAKPQPPSNGGQSSTLDVSLGLDLNAGLATGVAVPRS